MRLVVVLHGVIDEKTKRELERRDGSVCECLGMRTFLERKESLLIDVVFLMKNK